MKRIRSRKQTQLKNSEIDAARRSAPAAKKAEFIKGVRAGLRQAERGEFVTVKSLRADLRGWTRQADAPQE